jgi:ParB family transcriptional regulator, chromosome partitioning protein
MSVSPPKPSPQPTLLVLPVDSIRPNSNNPRLVFPQDELDRLADSIDQEGILVPIAVYRDGDGYVLVDGERRFKCAQILGLTQVPALITAQRPEHEVLVQMFNIHLIREPWRDHPTALALGRLVESLVADRDDGAIVEDKELKELTGLSIERVRQLRFVLTLPPAWQDYIADGTIPLNFFWELKRNIVDPLARTRPTLHAELGGSDAIAEAFVQKRLDGVITDTVGLRKVRPIINFAAEDAGSADAASILDENIRDLVRTPDLNIDDVYEDTVQIMVEADKLERRTRSMISSFDRLLQKARTDDDRQYVLTIGRSFLADLRAILK